MNLKPVNLELGIDHAVLQFETEPCGNGTLLCETFVGKNKEQLL